MKFLLPLLLAAPAVMGRACRSRHRTSKVVSVPAHTQASSVVLSSTFVSVPSAPTQTQETSVVVTSSEISEPTASIVFSSIVPIAVSSSASVVPTTLVTSAAPASTSTSSGSGSGSDSGSDTPTGSTELSSDPISGSSTFYGGNLSGGTCSFTTYTLPSGIYGTAYSGQVWNGAANCGACIEVTGPSGTITAMIVDQCPECNEGHLDLFPDAFTAVGGTDGVVDTSYKFVTCGITSPIVLHNKSGTSPYWFSMQVVNSNEPVKSLEVSTDSGKTWQSTTRKDYNFFEYQSGFGTETVDVKVTSTTGKTITVSNVSIEADSQHKASSNF